MELLESSLQYDIGIYLDECTLYKNLWPEEERLIAMEECEKLLWQVTKAIISQVYKRDVSGIIG